MEIVQSKIPFYSSDLRYTSVCTTHTQGTHTTCTTNLEHKLCTTNFVLFEEQVNQQEDCSTKWPKRNGRKLDTLEPHLEMHRIAQSRIEQNKTTQNYIQNCIELNRTAQNNIQNCIEQNRTAYRTASRTAQNRIEPNRTTSRTKVFNTQVNVYVYVLVKSKTTKSIV